MLTARLTLGLSETNQPFKFSPSGLLDKVAFSARIVPSHCHTHTLTQSLSLSRARPHLPTLVSHVDVLTTAAYIHKTGRCASQHSMAPCTGWRFQRTRNCMKAFALASFLWASTARWRPGTSLVCAWWHRQVAASQTRLSGRLHLTGSIAPHLGSTAQGFHHQTE